MIWLMSSRDQSGFTLLEVLITIFIIGTVVAGMFGLFLMTLRGAQAGERRIVAVALANERMEMIRNLPYVSVGTIGGAPSGAISQEETITRNAQSYAVRTDIRYVDDDYDGEVGAPIVEEERITICHQPGTPAERTLEVPAPALDAHLAHGDTTGACGSQGEGTPAGDEYNADYKQVRVEVSWPSQYEISPVLLITYVAPQGIEGGDAGGTLDFHAFDASGEAVEGATLVLTNDEVDPPIAITTETNSEGRVVLPGLPPASDSYYATITKDSYTQEQTYDATGAFNPVADYAPFSMIIKQVTPKTFFIDRTSTLEVTTRLAATPSPSPLPNIGFSLKGTKIIGHDALDNPVYKVDSSDQTNAQGQATRTALDWDTYTFAVNGVTTGYDIKETSLVLPLTIPPGTTTSLAVTLVPHTTHSLHVTVVDSTGSPIDNATVRLLESATSYDQTQVTGQLGQVLFSDIVQSETYSLTLDAAGFEPVTQVVKVIGTTRVQIELNVGGS